MPETPETPEQPAGSEQVDAILLALRERAKELECLYRVEEILARPDLDVSERLRAVARTVGPGWQYPETCEAVITLGHERHPSRPFTPTPWVMSAPIRVRGREEGRIEVYYLEERPEADRGPFLKEEERLIASIADRLGIWLAMQELAAGDGNGTRGELVVEERDEVWRGPAELLRLSDQTLYLSIARKLINHLCWMGLDEAQDMLREAELGGAGEEAVGEQNVPERRRRPVHEVLLSDRPFLLAAKHLRGAEILALMQKWLQEDKASGFLKTLNNPYSPFGEVADAVRRYGQFLAAGGSLAEPTRHGLQVSLVRRFLTEQLDYIKCAKEYFGQEDFQALLDAMIMTDSSRGRLGGKSAGLLLAHKIVAAAADAEPSLAQVRVPKAAYIVSDALLDFIAHNDLADVLEQKYKDVAQVRREYPNVVQLFKNSHFPPALVRSLTALLDDFGEVPLIVRSSSLLEDRLGTSFAGKYKSLFLANQGERAERLDALLDAIAEIYASVFGPDPVEYRRERGLLDFNEEMGILIEEVVGRRVGRYFLPAFAGVAFSNNEFRWSPRIRREDGLIRLVPGLGTRAVDRIGDDYPILVVPGQPNLRANVAMDEKVRYSPREIDFIDLERRTLRTLPIKEFLAECGTEFPGFEKVFSLLEGGDLRRAARLLVDPEQDDLVATFAGLMDGTPFVRQVAAMLRVLQEQLKTPVDIEFAHDGEQFYLLQCRPQSYADEDAPAPIPKELAPDDVLFTANRYVSNGWVPDITHIVYVDARQYADLDRHEDLLAVGRAVSALNKLLPKRQFVLIGPGRWGSRGDIRLGVNVSYSDINNSAMLIEVARRQGSYVPDLSFGTHFFQDLVESRIRYLPLYPDERDVLFNERFLARAPNLLAEMLPEFAELQHVLRVIDVPAASGGRVLQVLLNADLDEAVGLLAATGAPAPPRTRAGTERPQPSEQFWRWRQGMAERIAAELDPARFGVAACYVFGSTKNGTAGPCSDIDLLVHFRGNDEQERELRHWLEGWSLCLAEMNYLRTGYRTGGLLDVHLVTDADIAARDSFALKIGAVTDPAQELRLGG
ncbi:MAG: PEP/pyruvate-binding domain-containing protein [Candidatus Krumholzibacteriia bacterium]|nr:nucleotidyltransferase domain-containing protein [Candidatus Latescibacterota bacterium]